MAETKAAFRLRCARRIGIINEFTTTSAGATDGSTIVAVGLIDRDPDALTNLWVRNPATGDQRKVIEYEPISGIAALSRAFSAQIATSTSLELYRHFGPDDLDEAMRAAVEECYPYLHQIIVDTSLTTSADTYEYTIPSTIEDLERSLGGKVELEVNETTATWPYAPLHTWSTRRVANTSSASYTLVINPTEHLSGRTLRLTGLGPLAYPSTDATSIPLPTMSLRLLSLLTLSILYDRASAQGGSDTSFAAQQAQKFRAEYEQHKDEWGFVLEPGSIQDQLTAVQSDLPLAYFAEPA